MNALERIQVDISSPSETYADPGSYPRISVINANGLLHVDFFGSPFEEPYERLCEALVDPSIAAALGSLMLRTPDEGANGTCNWDLSLLAGGDHTFPSLTLLSIQQNGPSDHNRMIVAATYDEAGVLGAVLQKAPVLDALVTPSAPDEAFFAVKHHPLRFLSVDSGYDHQGFIERLSSTQCFPQLATLEFGEYNEPYMDDFSSRCTPLSAYRRLFQSVAFRSVRSFTWRNPVCTPAEIAELRSLGPTQLQFKVVTFSSAYIRP